MAGRARKFSNLGDVTCDKLRRDHVFVAERRFLSQAVEMTLGAIALDGSDGAGVTGVLVADSGLVDGEGVLVGAGRGLSRRVGVHCWNDTLATCTFEDVIPMTMRVTCGQVRASLIGSDAHASKGR